MKTNGAFITIHGIDGTGKTTVSRLASEVLDQRGQPAVLFDDIQMSNVFDRHKTDFSDSSPYAKMYYSLGSKVVQSQIIIDKMKSGVSVVKDRWAIDVFADASHKLSTNGTQPSTTIPTFTDGIVIPDLAVLLHCSDDSERIRRIHNRGNPTNDDLLENKPGTRASFFEGFLFTNIDQMARRVIAIDVVDIPIDDVVSRVVDEASGLYTS